ncbi:hypothetical protein PR048_029987 [Dryococelus australis]|uniref:DUF7869 domain-containing protein n=1 Tax=Dryococelus australis TaxID=614101 RepID=A0ABQ9G7N7_9NEOP|nr:hypothetical protein PR048_029987 [Dryococelus australis]
MTKKFLEPTLSIRKIEVSPLPSEDVYQNIYNIHFFTPCKDKCLICKCHKEAKGEEKDKLKKEYEAHIKRNEEANINKEEDKKRANNIIKTFMNAGPVYYSRKLCTYNLTMSEAAPTNKTDCFTWNECSGKRGSNQIVSCILEWFKTLPDFVKGNICGGQNRNHFVAALFSFIVQTTRVKVIQHKYMEKGHIKMEVDSMHSAFEYA